MNVLYLEFILSTCVLLFKRLPANNHLGDDPEIPDISLKNPFISDVLIN